jgi:hypothetical protein
MSASPDVTRSSLQPEIELGIPDSNMGGETASGSCEKITGREVAAGLPRHISSVFRTAMAG